MQKISYMRATISCLPVVGPVIGLYNLKEVDRELSVLSCNAFAEIAQDFRTATEELKQKTSVLNMVKQGKSLYDIATANLSTNHSSQDNSNVNLSKQKKIISLKEHILIYRKGLIYSVCGIIGNISTVAMMVNLIPFRNIVANPFSALAVTASIINVFCIATLIIQSCELCHLGISHTRDNKELQALTT